MPIRDPERRRQQMAAARARARLRCRLWLKEYLRLNPCVDCGQTDIRVLEFDHRDPARKVANVGRMARSGVSVEAVIREVAKCDVRCANCHRIRTIKEHHSSFRRGGRVTIYDTGG